MPAMRQEATPTDIALQKERYSKELAAYTFQQWEMARRALEQSRSQSSDKPKPRRHSSTSSRNSGKPARSSPGQGLMYKTCLQNNNDRYGFLADAGIQSIDYARKSFRHTGVTGHEGRAVDPGMA